MGLWARHTRDRNGEARHEATARVRKERTAELLVSGATIKEIAAELGVHPGTAYAIARDPDVVASIRATFEQRRNAAARELDAGTFEAVRYLRRTLGDTMATTKERIKCAVELLDRGGIPRGVKLDIHNNDTGTSIEIDDVSALTDEQIEAAARVALERRARIKITP